jgi:predicted dinucleotide-binding enzyme
MARAIGALAVAGGNAVEVVGRDQSKAADLATALGGATTGEFGAVPAGDIVIVALRYADVVPVVTEYGNAFADKVSPKGFAMSSVSVGRRSSALGGFTR